jgi:CubicO group peptidase (beta-lactamase class C family)
MTAGARRWLLVTILVLVAAVGCSAATTPPPAPSKGPIDYAALEADIEKAITTGPPVLDNVRAVLVSVDGEAKIAHYRHGFAPGDYVHVFSVTKSVLAVLIGIAIADGLIADVDQPLSELLPKHRKAMSDDTAKVTLRHLMTMSAGFKDDPQYAWARSAEPGVSFVDVLLARRQEIAPGRTFSYTDASAHLTAAVLASALERAGGDHPGTVLAYARERLFDPLGISTRPAFDRPLPDPFAPNFVTAGFGWGTDPEGIHLGGIGLRLTAPDMMKIGELYRRGGVWNGQQIVPSSWIEQCTSPSAVGRVGGPDEYYGLLWWVFTTPEPGYNASGHGGQRIFDLPESQAVIVYLAEVPPGGGISSGDELNPLTDVFVSAFLS